MNEEIKKLQCLLTKKKLEEAERRSAEEIFSRFIKDTFLMSSEEFIRSLVSYLASVFEFRYCLISELASPDRKKARTLAVYANGDFAENFEYDLVGTPCHKVFHKGSLCYYPNNAQELFPRDHILKEMGIESYIGIPLFSSSDNMLGILVGMNDKAVVHEAKTKSIMEIFSIRAALELDRRQKEDELRKFKYAVNQSPSIVIITDREGIIEYANPIFTETIGYTFQEVIGKNPNILKSGVHPPGFYQEMWQTITSGKIWRNHFCNRKKNGEIYWESASISAIKDIKGNIVSFIKIAEDITVRKTIEEELHRSETSLSEAQRIAHLGNWNWDIIKNETYWSDETYRIFGLTPKKFDATYETFLNFIHVDDKEFVNKSVTESLNNRKPYRIDFRIIRTDGIERIVNAQGEVTYDKSGKAIQMAGTVLDITERKKMEEQLRTLSLTDELTGLYNRRGFFTLTEHLLKIVKRQNRGIFMLYGDLDNLKEINDHQGHVEGDQAIIDFANILKANQRESDIVARLGGDEFAVIPVGYEGDNVEAITDRLQKKLDVHNERNNRKYELSVSIGIIYYDPKSPCTIDELLAQVDELMYKQKKRKKKSLLHPV